MYFTATVQIYVSASLEVSAMQKDKTGFTGQGKIYCPETDRKWKTGLAAETHRAIRRG